MCGIAGFILPEGGRAAGMAAVVRAMTERIAHRGPDDAGLWTDAAAGVALGHRRLAILDLSERGHQPMASADGRFVLTYNGEIYNFGALRAELAAKGHRFDGGSDTEVLLAAIVEWGVVEACRRCVGMFAFAVWDVRDRVLHLARDPLGKKPLYCGRAGDRFAFASELAAIRAVPGFASEIDRGALAGYLRHTYVPGDRAIWRGLFKLPPGSVLSLPAARAAGIDGLEAAGPFLRRFWEFGAAARAGLSAPLDLSEAAAVAALDDVLGTAVAERLASDVALGAFLSGGVDSSLIVALMQERAPRPVRTFTIGFQEGLFDEAPHAAAVARHLGTDHTELYCRAADAEALVPEIAGIYDEPFADPSQVPTLLVSRLTRRHVTVALTGDGGDELFAGYRRYRTAGDAWRRIGGLPPSWRAAAAGGLRRAPLDAVEAALSGVPFLAAGRDREGRGLHQRVLKFADCLGAPDRMEFYRRKMAAWQRPEEILAGGQGASGGGRADAPPDAADFVSAMMWADTVGYLPDDILVKVDRASMSVGLETRCPLLDFRVVEFAWRLPLAMKLRDGQGKWILRRLLERHVPPALTERPKQGFTPPVADWLRGPLRDWAEDLLDPAQLSADGFFDPAAVRRTWDEHVSGRRSWGNRLWTVLMFNGWLREQRAAASPGARASGPPFDPRREGEHAGGTPALPVNPPAR